MSKRVTQIVISHGLNGFICWYGIEKVFQRSIGINVFQTSLLAILYIATSALLNVPTGVIADKFGRKKAIIAATIILLASTLVGAVARNISQYAISTVLWGLFYTTQNGAYEALLYETLREEGREDQYARISGLNSAGFWIAIFISSIIGAWVGSHFGLRKAFLITAIPNALNIFLALSLYEPKNHGPARPPTSISMLSQGFKFLISSREVLVLASIYLLIAVTGWMTNEFGQLFFIELGFSVFVVGLLNASSGLFQAVGNYIGHVFSPLTNRRMAALLLVMFAVTFALPLRLRLVSAALFMIFVLMRNIFYIANNTALQHRLPDHIRATTLSSLGMVNEGILVVSYLLFGVVSQHNTVRTGYLSVGLIAVLLLVVGKFFAGSTRYKVISAVTEPILIDETDSVPR